MGIKLFLPSPLLVNHGLQLGIAYAVTATSQGMLVLLNPGLPLLYDLDRFRRQVAI